MNWTLIGLGFLFFLYIILIIVYVVDAYKKKRTEILIDYNITLPSVEYVTNNDKVIWSYWGQFGDYSFMTKVAIHSWKYTNPDYKIAMLTPTMIYQYLDAKDLPDNYISLDLYRREDAIKLAILEKYGGVWVETNVLLTKSIMNDWLPINYDLGAFYITDETVTVETPILDTSFLVAPKNSRVVREWRRQASILMKGRIIENMSAQQLNFQHMPMVEARVLQCAFLKAMTVPQFSSINLKASGDENIPTLKLRSGDDGPYKHRKEVSIKLLTTPVEIPLQPILILLPSTRRNIANSWFLLSENSVMDRIIKQNTS